MKILIFAQILVLIFSNISYGLTKAKTNSLQEGLYKIKSLFERSKNKKYNFGVNKKIIVKPTGYEKTTYIRTKNNHTHDKKLFFSNKIKLDNPLDKGHARKNIKPKEKNITSSIKNVIPSAKNIENEKSNIHTHALNKNADTRNKKIGLLISSCSMQVYREKNEKQITKCNNQTSCAKTNQIKRTNLLSFFLKKNKIVKAKILG